MQETQVFISMMQTGATSYTRGAKTFACRKVNGDMFIYPIIYKEITRQVLSMKESCMTGCVARQRWFGFSASR